MVLSDEPIFRAGIEMHMWRTNSWTQWGRRWWDKWRERHGNIYMTMYKINS